jgi:tight adherence protein C
MLTSIPLLVALLAFCSVFLLSWGFLSYVGKTTKSREMVKKIHWERDDGSETLSTDSPLTRDGNEKTPWLRCLSALGKWAAGSNEADYSRMRLNFLKAGLSRPNMPALFWGSKCFLALLLSTTFILTRVTVLHVFNPYTSLVLCLLFALFGFYLPDLWLSIKTSRRKERIGKGLPDALDLMVVSVEAGMGLDTTINRVAQEIRLTNKDLSDELKMYNLELTAGKSRHDALKNLALRTDLEDINSLVTLLIQADKFGTSVGHALRVYSDTFRTKRYLKAEEVAAKMPLKMIVVLIFCIFPALFVVILGPPIIRLLHQFNIIS